MSKVQRELHLLKKKAEEQETKLIQDDRILKLENDLKWFTSESDKLKGVLACSSQDIEYWRDKNENLEEDKRLLET